MPATTKPTRTGRTKCYLHGMQRPLDLPYSRLRHEVCEICHSRLLELAKAGFEYKLRDQVVTISIKPEDQIEEEKPEKG